MWSHHGVRDGAPEEIFASTTHFLRQNAYPGDVQYLIQKLWPRIAGVRALVAEGAMSEARPEKHDGRRHDSQDGVVLPNLSRFPITNHQSIPRLGIGYVRDFGMHMCPLFITHGIKAADI